MKKLIVNFTPTGMIPTKEMTPYVPETVEEIVSEVDDCAQLGVSMVHIHARDSEGNNTFKKEVYREIISGIRKNNNEIVIIASTSGRHYSEFEKRADVLDLEDEFKPDMASLTLGSVNFNKIASVNPPEMIHKLAQKMKEKDIKPELEVFDLGMVNYAHYLIRKGLLDPPYYFNIILGSAAAAQAKLLHLGLIVSELPDNSIWSVGGVGKWQQMVNAIGVVSGEGNVRVGLEDNIWYDDERTVLATNKMLVKRVIDLAVLVGRPLATPGDVRDMLNLSKN